LSNSPAWTWARQTFCPGNPCGSHDGQSIGVDNDGNCYFTAYFSGQVTIDGVDTISATHGLSLYDYLVGKFDFGGFPQGLVKGSVSADDESRGLAVDRVTGDVYVTGFASGANITVDGGRQVALFKYNSNLDLQWTQLPGGSSATSINAGRAVALDSAGCVYMTGSFTDYKLQFANFVNNGVTTLSAPVGTTRMFVAKYCPTCSTGCVPAVITAPLRNAQVSSAASPAKPVSFTVTANGTPPLYFQWYRNTAPLSPAGSSVYTITPSPDGFSSTLRLTGVPGGGTTDFGTYSVYISNPCCDCTAAASHANVFYLDGRNTTPLPFDAFGRFTLGVTTGSGIPFNVEYRDDLNPGTPWRFLTNAVGTGFSDNIFDPNPNPLMRFYQIAPEPSE
jgi:hypothetical protein